jgi:hypothetical protein
MDFTVLKAPVTWYGPPDEELIRLKIGPPYLGWAAMDFKLDGSVYIHDFV